MKQRSRCTLPAHQARLDLQGGMRVVLEVNTIRLIGTLQKTRMNNCPIIKEVADESSRSDDSPVNVLRKKLRKKGFASAKLPQPARLKRGYCQIPEDESTKATIAQWKCPESRRPVWVRAIIQKLGGSRIIVETARRLNESEVRKLLQGTALLEFKL